MNNQDNKQKKTYHIEKMNLVDFQYKWMISPVLRPLASLILFHPHVIR